MWGNSLGWLISAAIALATAGLLAFLAFGGGAVSSPTTFSSDERNLAVVELPVAPASLVATSEDHCDAGPLYREAMGVVGADMFTYREFARAGKLAGGEKVRAGVDPVVRATNCGGMRLFSDRPEDVVNYANQKPAMEELTLLGQACADRLGLLNDKAGNSAEAKKYYEAAFALGAKLYRERVCWAECELGLSLMGRTASALAALAEKSGDAERAKRFRAFDEGRIKYVNERINPMLRVVRSIDPKVVAEHAGDLFVIADSSPERMWRVEAILALGRLRYFAGASGRSVNQRAAMVRLRELQNDPDAVIRAAAKAAVALTAEEYRLQ
jgi:hypothetical protein